MPLALDLRPGLLQEPDEAGVVDGHDRAPSPCSVGSMSSNPPSAVEGVDRMTSARSATSLAGTGRPRIRLVGHVVSEMRG